MKKTINKDNYGMFCYTNAELLQETPVGIAVVFAGLGNQTIYEQPNARDYTLAKRRILHVYPYLNPWSWTNAQAIAQTDDLLDVIKEIYGELPVVSTGGSMGGHGCLIYAKYSRHHPIACVANCPVCDLIYHYSERPDLPRTLLSAYGNVEAETLEDAMRPFSPLYLAQRQEMPRIHYSIFHCTEDEAVNKKLHSDKFVTAMRAYSDVEYIPVAGHGHCDLPQDMIELFDQCIEDAVHVK